MSNNRDKSHPDDQKHHGSRTQKILKSVTFSTKVAAPLTSILTSHGKNNSGNSDVATTNSNRHRHHSHVEYHHPTPQFNGNQSHRQLYYSTSEEDSDETEESPEVEESTPPEEPSPIVTSKHHILELPENVIETLFTFLRPDDLRRVGMACGEWARIVNDGNNEVWRYHCLSTLHSDSVQSTLLAELPTFKTKLRAFFHAWNPHDCSRNIYVKPNGFTIHRNPVAQSTDGVRGKIGFQHGRHAWEVVWEGPLGTVAVVGIATKRAEMRAQGYVPLLGQDDQSWGWNLVENCLLHNGDSPSNYPTINNAPRYQVGERIRVILDCDDRTLSFEKDYEFYGVAFRGLPSNEPLYPAISAVYGNTEVSMIYTGPPLDG